MNFLIAVDISIYIFLLCNQMGKHKWDMQNDFNMEYRSIYSILLKIHLET